ncbi:hypothetical protein F01_460102 [Burkholderia cenocepacia]|nr:hypothetical protein F01_460102 [Burkholderia cenocepacia]
MAAAVRSLRRRSRAVRPRSRLRAQLSGARLQSPRGRRRENRRSGRNAAAAPGRLERSEPYDVRHEPRHNPPDPRRRRHQRAARRVRRKPVDRLCAGEGVHEAEPAGARHRAEHVRAPAGRCARGCDLVRTPRHGHRLRDRGVRPRSGQAGRPHDDHDALLPRAGRRPAPDRAVRAVRDDRTEQEAARAVTGRAPAAAGV